MNLIEELKLKELYPSMVEKSHGKDYCSLAKECGLQIPETIEINPFSEEKIKQTCIKYNLKFLPIKYFRKLIPEENLIEIKKYKDLNPDKSIFILAPSEFFANKKFSTPKGDPIVFGCEKIDYWGFPEEANFEKGIDIVTSWGNDFSLFRKLNALRFINPWSNIYHYLKWVIPPSILILLTHPPFPINFVIPTTFSIAYLLARIMDNSFSPDINQYRTEDYWNSNVYPKLWQR